MVLLPGTASPGTPQWSNSGKTCLSSSSAEAKKEAIVGEYKGIVAVAVWRTAGEDSIKKFLGV